MSLSASTTFCVPFHDVDSLKIVWHGHYYKYFELARTELYRSKGFDIQDMEQLGFVFPVIESMCKYVKPLVYGQDIEVRAAFKAWEHYIQISYQIMDAQSQERHAYGHTKQAVCLPSGELLLAVPDKVVNVIQD